MFSGLKLGHELPLAYPYNWTILSYLSPLTLVGFRNLTVAIIDHQFMWSLFTGSKDAD